VEDAVRWVLRRCFGSGTGSSFVVAYVDAGQQQPGRLLLAGTRTAISDESCCSSLVDTLLTLYGELGPDPAGRLD
jgi:hypothetical protein